MENFSSSAVVCSILGLVAFVVVAILLIILWRKGLLTQKAFDALGDLVDGVIVPEDGPIGTLAYYARLAVRAVEQLVKSGQLDTTENADAIRREKALELVEEYAAASGPALTDKEISTVRSLIEAEVYELRHTEAAMLVETIPMVGRIETVSPAAAAAAGTEEAAPAANVTGTVAQTKDDAVAVSVKKSARRGSARKGAGADAKENTKKQPDEPAAYA